MRTPGAHSPNVRGTAELLGAGGTNAPQAGDLHSTAPHPSRASRRKPFVDRFWAKVDRGADDACWLWTGCITSRGYGQIRNETDRRVVAHRVAYELLVGPIPEGLTLDHLCRTRACVNPAHLDPVTMRENILRGEAPAASHARQTHCKRGHEFTEANTYRRRDHHGRQCRACTRARSKRLYHAAKAP